MNRPARSCPLVALLVVVSTAFALAPSGVCRAANIQFNFNSNDGGWTGTSPPADPWWQWEKSPSSEAGGWQGFMGSPGDLAIAYLESPCLEILQESQSQTYIHVDISHQYAFPEGMQGQVQFNFNTGSGWQANWLAVPSSAWTHDGDHDVPLATALTPLLSGPAFDGTSDHLPTGGHGNSVFELPWADWGGGLQNGDEIRFRFALARTGTLGEDPGIDPLLVWEINDVQIDGAKLCAVPEPDGLTLASIAAVVGGAGLAGRRARRRLTAVAAPA